MKRVYAYLLSAGLVLTSFQLFAQNRYIDEIFSEVEVTSDVTYATNIDFLRSSRLPTASTIKIGTELTIIKTALAMGQAIPGTHYNLADTNSVIKVQDIKMDIYEPKSDTVSARPVVIFLHTGNFLPSPLNGTPTGTKTDSSAIVVCRALAKRGYVAISADYRLGWNPLAGGATGEFVRRGTLLNAVYRSLQDIKQCVMGLRVDAAGTNTYSIDPDKIILYGEGSGAYVANAYITLDKYSEIELTKFKNPLTNKSFVDTAQVGRIDGSGIPQALTLYGPPRASADVSGTIATGGALADTSWLEAGDKPMIAFQCVRDPFAPFGEGTVIVTTTNENVVEVQGANLYIQKAVALGNNDVFKDLDDVYSAAARSRYGKTYDYIYPAPLDKITVNTEVDGLFPMDLKAGATIFENQASPWQWWDPTSPLATHDLGGGITTHMASLRSNPDMSPTKGRTYVDTILGYSCPRMAVIHGYYTPDDLSSKTFETVQANAYPNPTHGVLYINIEDHALINSIRVLDLTGKEVMSVEDVRRSFIDLDMSELINGYYIVQIDTENGRATQKVALTK